MKKAVSRITLAIAAVSMAFLPVAAQANTRAGDSGAIYGAEASSAGAIFGAVYDDEEAAVAWGAILGVLAGILAAGLVLGASSGGGGGDNSVDQSRGT